MNWEAALSAYDRDLRMRGSAERTRRAYGVDLGGFAEWAGEQGLGPGEVRHRDVRRYGAGLSSAGAAPATVARKLAAIRGLYGYLVRTEKAGANPWLATGLEWTTQSPPLPDNFEGTPVVTEGAYEYSKREIKVA